MSSFLLKHVYKVVKEFPKNHMLIKSVLVEPWSSAGVNSNTTYIDKTVLEHIKKTMKVQTKINYIFDGTPINATIVFSRMNYDRVVFLMSMLNLFIMILNRIKRTPKSLNITLINCNKKKVKPEDGRDLTSEHVNTGVTFTYFGQDYGEIIVFREEEMIKVLLHELIHFYDLDDKRVESSKESQLNNMFGLKGRSININESFTDTLACIINVVTFCALKCHDQGCNYSGFLKECKRVFKIEYNHILKQSLNILIYNGYKINGNAFVPTRTIQETTSVTSYYVLKAIVFSNIDSFLKYVVTTNFTLININEYINIILASMPNFFKAIQPLYTAPMKKSLRMSVIDIVKLQKIKLYKDLSNQYNIKKWLLKNQPKK